MDKMKTTTELCFNIDFTSRLLCTLASKVLDGEEVDNLIGDITENLGEEYDNAEALVAPYHEAIKKLSAIFRRG